MDYTNGKIYVLRDTTKPEQPIIYVGGTTQALSKRFYEHKARATKSDRPQQIHKYIVEELGGFDNVKIELFEEYPCENVESLHKREGEVQRELIGQGVELKNVVINNRTKEEYQNDNRERMKQRYKEYYEKNKERINESKKEYRKEYYEKNKQELLEKQKQYREENPEIIKERKKADYIKNRDRYIEKSREWYNQNKDRASQTGKEYYEANKAKLLAKVKCEVCDIEVTKASFLRHTKTKKHKDRLNVV